jgi:hypothetical protein
MLQFDKIIKAEFEDVNLDKIVKKISHHNLYVPIIKSIDLINRHLKEAKHELDNYGTLQVSHIATALLIKINEYLRNLKLKREKKEKQDLEYILGNVFRRVLVQITSQLPSDKKIKFATVIYSSLKETCELYNYDFLQLMSFLSIENYAYEKVVSNYDTKLITPDSTNSNQIPCYFWTSGSSEEFSAFVQILKKHEIAEDAMQIENLFKNPTKNLAIKLDEKRVVFVMQFLSCLNDTKFISANGYGFYQVLQCHVRNFENVFLKNKTPQRMVDGIKKLKSWKPTKKMLEKEFKDLIISSSSKVS